MPGGDFSSEAYEQLREAYAKEKEDQRTAEERGFDIMGLNLGLETAPVDSPWADKIELWEYPDGKSDYEDKKQSPDEILQIMRDAAQERIEADTVEVEEEETEDESVEEETEEQEEDGEETSDDDDGEDDDEDDEEEDDDDDEVEEDEEEETLPEPDDIASEIAELRAELEQMQFVPESSDDES
tara:strand:- start:651 stop:1202 length:552 start_codon:yes stop_codon:yes gene_type:complete